MLLVKLLAKNRLLVVKFVVSKNVTGLRSGAVCCLEPQNT